MDTISYLGPEGTFTHQAAKKFRRNNEELLPLPSIRSVIDSVRDGAVTYGVVPIENAIEGAVSTTLDILGFESEGVFMREETDVPIDMNLLAFKGTKIEDIKEIRSHQVAIPQCNRWLNENLPSVNLVETASTGKAAKQVFEAGPSSGLAALGNKALQELLGLEIIASGIQDLDTNATRFALLGRSISAPTGHDRTSVVVFLKDDHPGQLLRVLERFASRGINLSRIISRPTRKAFGDYAMFIDLHGHVDDNHVGNALRAVKRHVGDVRILGSVPRVDGEPTDKPYGESDQHYEEARQWYDELRSHIDYQ